MVCKCKICGGSVTVDQKSNIAVCDYCGTKQVMPRFSDDSSRILFERGNHYLSVSEYDKAASIFNQLVAANPNDPEFYWDLVLCEYGVTFVCDPQTGKYIPTCNRTHFASVLNDRNYQKAIELSTPENAAFYKESADTIDNIQKGILSVFKKEKPFDIFISYKETDANGNRTKDSIVAQELYEKLTAKGYKVFFSRITLEDKVGSQYEPYIYSVLYSSKTMLTVCSSRENIEAVWVRNEWSRFISLQQKDAEKVLIPLYWDMDKSDLPEKFSLFVSKNMSDADFEQELFRGIEKIIAVPVTIAEKRRKLKRNFKIASIILGVILIIGAVALIPWLTKLPDYNAAMQLYCDNKYPDATWAFEKLGKFKDSEEMKEKAN